MKMIIETPSSLLLDSFQVHGANKISKILLHLFSIDLDTNVIVVSNISAEESNELNKRDTLHAVHYVNYAMLDDYLTDQHIVPDIGVSFDIKCDTLAMFRNINDYFFPVVGLIHSLGLRQDFEDLQRVSKVLSPYDTLICPSENTQQTAINLGLDSTHTDVAHYGLDHKKYVPINNKNKLRKQLNLPLNTPIVLILSRISPAVKMDLTPVFRRLPTILKSFPDVVFYIVGDVLDSQYVEQLKQFCVHLGIEKHVVWEHHPTHDAIEQYYQASDIFLSLSDYCGETFGLTVMEAMACGLPVVISEFAGYKAHITDGKEGFYIPTYTAIVNVEHKFHLSDTRSFGREYSQSIVIDLDVLTEKLGILLSSKERVSSMGQAARLKIEEHNTLDHMKNRYKSIFQRRINQVKNVGGQYKKPNFIDASALLSHQVTCLLQDTDILSLSDRTRQLMLSNTLEFMFDYQLKTYKLIRVILTILQEKDFQLDELAKKLTVSRKEVDKNCLFLLKQSMILLNDN